MNEPLTKGQRVRNHNGFAKFHKTHPLRYNPHARPAGARRRPKRHGDVLLFHMTTALAFLMLQADTGSEAGVLSRRVIVRGREIR